VEVDEETPWTGFAGRLGTEVRGEDMVMTSVKRASPLKVILEVSASTVKRIGLLRWTGGDMRLEESR
jgi:hypothetical protein